MGKLFFIILSVSLFFSCKDEKIDNESNLSIDESILGTWRVVYSQSIDSVRITSDGFLKPIGSSDTLSMKEYFGQAGEEVRSYMFGEKENIIEIRKDNRIKVYFLNQKGGITITNDYIFYRINNKMLIYSNGKNDLFHHYFFNRDTLIIERIPDETVMWKYKLSKYCRTDNI